MKNFRVKRCVVDALPETRNARAFAERNRGLVYLNYYNERQKGAYAWNEKDMMVAATGLRVWTPRTRKSRKGGWCCPKHAMW